MIAAAIGAAMRGGEPNNFDEEVALREAAIRPVLRQEVVAGACGQEAAVSGSRRAARNVAVHVGLGDGPAAVAAALAAPQSAQRGGRRHKEQKVNYEIAKKMGEQKAQFDEKQWQAEKTTDINLDVDTIVPARIEVIHSRAEQAEMRAAELEQYIVNLRVSQSEALSKLVREHEDKLISQAAELSRDSAAATSSTRQVPAGQGVRGKVLPAGCGAKVKQPVEATMHKLGDEAKAEGEVLTDAEIEVKRQALANLEAQLAALKYETYNMDPNQYEQYRRLRGHDD